MSTDCRDQLANYRYRRRLERLALIQERGLLPAAVLALEKILIDSAKECLSKPSLS